MQRITIPLHTDRRKFIIVMQRLLAAGDRGRYTCPIAPQATDFDPLNQKRDRIL